MRVVLDTNVLIAAFVARGRCAELVEHCAEAHDLVTSEELLAEYRGKLIKKFRVREEQAAERVALLRTIMHIVTPVPLSSPASRDPDDDVVLATALAGRCQCIVTGDKDLLVLHPFSGIDIIQPGQFTPYEADG